MEESEERKRREKIRREKNVLHLENKYASAPQTPIETETLEER